MISAIMDKAEQAALTKLGKAWSQLKICELGNQQHLVHSKPAKEVYLARGVIEHVSMDLNAKDGALLVDLSRPIDKQFRSRFNLVTNYGTTEHVSDQYWAFKNIHDMCEINGIMIHALVLPGNWPEHCQFYYSDNFTTRLAECCEYTIVETVDMCPLDTYLPNRLVKWVVFIKNQPRFVKKSWFLQLPIIDTGWTVRTGDYYSRPMSR